MAVVTESSILIIDDSSTNIRLVSKMIEHLGHKIHIAKDGVQALKLLTKLKPSVILLDIQMPHMDGLEVCKRVRKFDANLPIIAVTANIFEADIRTYLDAGFTAHLGKPIDMSKLYRELKWHCLDNYL